MRRWCIALFRYTPLVNRSIYLISVHHRVVKPVEKPSFVLSIIIEGVKHNVYVIKRPGVDEFIQRLAQFYEVHNLSNKFFTIESIKYSTTLADRHLHGISKQVRRPFVRSTGPEKGNMHLKLL